MSGFLLESMSCKIIHHPFVSTSARFQHQQESTHDPEYLAKLALYRLPKPYTDEVILHVFCEIDRTPHLRRAYDGLMVGENGYTHVGLNREISYLSLIHISEPTRPY